MNNELVTLITILDNIVNDEGIVCEKETFEIEVFANEKSVGRTEFFKSLKSGHQAKMILEVDFDDYMLSEKEVSTSKGVKKIKASKARYQDVEYNILRTYKNGCGMLELTLTEIE